MFPKYFGVSLLAIFLVTVAMPSLAVAAEDGKPAWREWPLGQRLTLTLSAYRPRVNTALFAGADYEGNSIIGEIDFERDLGLDKRKSVLLAGLSWRFAKKHSLRLDYFNLERSTVSSPQVNITIRLDDGTEVTFGSGPGLLPETATLIDIDIYDLGYEYSLIFDERKDWSVGIGLSWQDFDIGIANPADVTQFARTDVQAPLPTFNTRFSYAFSDKWLVDLGFGWLDVKIDGSGSGEYDGKILRWEGGLRWQAFKNVGLTLGYEQFDVDIDAIDSNIGGRLEYDYRGPRLGISAFF